MARYYNLLNFLLYLGGIGGVIGTKTKYLGCYSDPNPSSRDLNGMDMSMQGMTVTLCTGQCQAAGFAYAGLQLGTRCFCGMSYGNYGPSTDCNTTCSNQYCGGYQASDVYYAVDDDVNSQRSLVVSLSSNDYISARMQCIQNGGDLATIDSTAIIASVIAKISTNVSTSNIWFGLRRRIIPGGAYEWTDENETPYSTDSINFINFWISGDTQQGDCVSLSVNSQKWQSATCTASLLYVCNQLSLSQDSAGTASSITAAPTADTSGQSKQLALIIVLPLFLICYGGSCLLYCVYKIIKNCRGKKMSKMSLVTVVQKPLKSQSVREKQPQPYTSNSTMIYPDQFLNQTTDAKKPIIAMPVDRDKSHVDLLTKTPVEDLEAKREDKENVLHSETNAVIHGRQSSTTSLPRSQVVAKDKPQSASKTTPREEQPELEHVMTGSTTNLIPNNEDFPMEEDDDGDMSISDFLKMKKAQKTEKKQPRKAIAS